MQVGRRAFLLAGASALLAACAGRRVAVPTATATRPAATQRPPQPSATPAPSTTPTVGATATALRSPEGIRLTPNADFYTVVYSQGIDRPRLDAAAWRLDLRGEVAEPRPFSLGEIEALPAVTVMRTLQCISNPVGGTLIGNAIWVGCRLADLLAEVVPQSTGRELVMESSDGYATSIPLAAALDPEALLVYRMNGEPLPHDHGFPVRVLLPGRYGQKQPKWLTRLEVVRQPFLGTWERQGWSNEAFVRVNSQIEAPRNGIAVPVGASLRIAGRAFAGAEAITQVEVSPDDGRSWLMATLRAPPPNVWTEWEVQWQPTEPGRAIIKARATDSAGRRQSRDAERVLGGTFPDGTSDIQAIAVRVEMQ